MSRALLVLMVLNLCLVLNTGKAENTGHQRVISLQGTQNTRDIGGYKTDNGRQVRWGAILRSDNLSRLTRDDFQRLESIGLKTVIDLRTFKEAEKAQSNWQGDHPPQFFHYPIGSDDGEWIKDQQRLLRSGSFSSEKTLDHYVTAYRRLPKVGLDSFRDLLALVGDQSNWPVLIHCSAGKDRSGVAIALILEILGVDRETIMDDYLLTNQVARTEQRAIQFAERVARNKPATGSRLSTRKPPSADAFFPFLGVKPEMLNGFYDSVDEQYGSMDAYLMKLGIDLHGRETWVQTLTE